MIYVTGLVHILIKGCHLGFWDLSKASIPQILRRIRYRRALKFSRLLIQYDRTCFAFVCFSARLGRLEVVLTTFETAREYVEDLNVVHWDAVIVDEVHKIKEPRSKITQALKSIK